MYRFKRELLNHTFITGFNFFYDTVVNTAYGNDMYKSLERIVKAYFNLKADLASRYFTDIQVKLDDMNYFHITITFISFKMKNVHLYISLRKYEDSITIVFDDEEIFDFIR